MSLQTGEYLRLRRKSRGGYPQVCRKAPERRSRCIRKRPYEHSGYCERLSEGCYFAAKGLTERYDRTSEEESEIFKIGKRCAAAFVLQNYLFRQKYEPGQTALEQILQISRIEDKYHEIGIYTEEDFWEAVFESAEAVKDGIYGFRMNNTAFSRDGEPARVFLVKYKDKYIVYTSEEYDGNYYPEEHLSDLEHDLFDDYNEAEKYFQSLENAGLLSGRIRLKTAKQNWMIRMPYISNPVRIYIAMSIFVSIIAEN